MVKLFIAAIPGMECDKQIRLVRKMLHECVWNVIEEPNDLDANIYELQCNFGINSQTDLSMAQIVERNIKKGAYGIHSRILGKAIYGLYKTKIEENEQFTIRDFIKEVEGS